MKTLGSSPRWLGFLSAILEPAFETALAFHVSRKLFAGASRRAVFFLKYKESLTFSCVFSGCEFLKRSLKLSSCGFALCSRPCAEMPSVGRTGSVHCSGALLALTANCTARELHSELRGQLYSQLRPHEFPAGCDTASAGLVAPAFPRGSRGGKADRSAFSRFWGSHLPLMILLFFMGQLVLEAPPGYGIQCTTLGCTSPLLSPATLFVLGYLALLFVSLQFILRANFHCFFSSV